MQQMFKQIHVGYVTVTIYFVVLDLEAMLSDNKDARTKLIVTDGVFSMDGNVAPLRYCSCTV